MSATAKHLILMRLQEAGKPLAVHQFHIYAVSDNALATRLSELAKEGKVVGKFPGGKPYKVWSLPEPKFNADGQGEMFKGAA